MKVIFVAALALAAVPTLAATPAAAQASLRNDVLAGAARCSGISDNRTWLNCYYGAAQPMRASLGLPPAPAAQTSLVPGMASGTMPLAPAPAYGETPPPAQHEQSSGGLLSALFGGKVLISNMPLAAYSFDSSGAVTVTLANGQIWEQVPGDNTRANWKNPAGRYAATIKVGALGSHNLMVTGDNRLYKVRRIR